LRALDSGVERVVSVSREPSKAPRTDDARLERVEADALRRGAWESALERVRPAAVILCTALPRIPDCESYPALARRINVDLPRAVATWCAANGARLVHVSTDLVFGADPAPPCGYREDAPTAPVSVYGSTKAEAEHAVLELHSRAVVARLPLLFGDSLGRGLGASESLLAAIARGEQPTLFEDEWRTPLDVRDAAGALIELAGGDFAGTLHVAGPECVNRVELGLAALRAHGFDDQAARSRIRVGRRAELGMERTRPADVSLDASRARELVHTRLRGVSEALASR